MSMRLPAFLRRRAVQLAAAILASVLVGACLAAAVHYTEAGPAWLTFLGGVLFASVLAVASNASRAEWAVLRRTRQLERVKVKLEQANTRRASATEAFRSADARLRGLGEALGAAVFLLDREGRCCFHNSAAARATGKRRELIDGHELPEILGQDLEAFCAGAQLVPQRATYPAGAPAEGTCLILAPRAPASAPIPAAPPADDTSRNTLYLKEIARELTGWDDPRAKLTRALQEDRFVLFEQKIVPLELGHEDPLCSEILLRLQEEEDLLLPPGGFLPEAERFGMMEELDRWVVKALIGHCLQQRKRDPSWRAPLYCVNLSSAALRAPNFAHYVQQQIQARGFDGRGLCFELGEPELIALPAEARRLVAMLAPFGCRFTVDAFGSVKGSFAPLKDLHVDFMKIDGVVIQNILRDPAQLARVRAINAVCRKSGMRSIAEFVENHETLTALRRIGVDYAQGFGVAVPGPLGAAERLAAVG